MAESAVAKLGLPTEAYPRPYKLAWLSKGFDINISRRVLIFFSIGSTYSDEILCDIVPMDACYLLLGCHGNTIVLHFMMEGAICTRFSLEERISYSCPVLILCLLWTIPLL